MCLDIAYRDEMNEDCNSQGQVIEHKTLRGYVWMLPGKVLEKKIAEMKVQVH